MKKTPLHICLLLMVLCISSCAQKKPQQIREVSVTTYEIAPQTIPVTLEFVGVAQSSHLVEIFSRVEGYLWKIAYTEGSYVCAGDLLFQIDPRQFEASVDEARGEVARQKAILWAAQKAVQRYEPLYQQKAASQRDLDNAIAHQLASEAALQSAEAKLIEAELNLSYTSIQSPISGLSGRSKYREGTLITPSVNGLLTTVSVLDPIWVIFSVSDSYLLSSREEISKNQLILPPNQNFDVSVTLADGSTLPSVGKVDFASPTLDENTGTMTVRAVFPNPEGILKPGQFVRAEVSGATRPNAIIVPQESVMQGSKGMYVFVVKDGKAEPRQIEPGEWFRNYWIIKNGLNVGDEVVVAGVNKITNQTPVKVIGHVPPPQLPQK